MKKIILSSLFALFVVSLFAQKNDRGDITPESETKVWVEKYNLTKAQEVKALKIQKNKFKNTDQISRLEDTDPNKHIQKMSANIRQSRFSLRMILDEEQTKILDQVELELRKKRAALSQKMQKEGASNLEIKRALLEFE